MNFIKNYKTRILMILLSGFFIVALITMISLYYVYQYKHVQLLNKSHSVVKLFEETFENILKDVNYLRNINFTNDTATILSDFKKMSLTMYKYNDNINAISLIQQFNTKNYEEIEKELSFMKDVKEFGIRPIPSIIENAKISKGTFSSIIMHSEPLEKTNKSVGIEISSEQNRYLGILNMQLFGNYVISQPVSLVHKYKTMTANSILFFPLSKDIEENFYEWFVAIPFTYNKILDNIFLNNSSLDNLCVELRDNDNNILATYETNGKDHMTLLLEKTITLGHKDYNLKIFTDSLFTLDTFWENLLGFIFGVLFLLFLGYYLFYKEKKNIEISKLKFGLSEAQKISSSGHCIWKKGEDYFTCSEGLSNILKLVEPKISLANLLKMVCKKEKRKLYHHIINLKKRKTQNTNNVTFKVLGPSCIIWLKIEYRVFYNEKNEIVEVFIVAQDITSFKELEINLKENNEELEKIAITDHLTGAFNRVYFDKLIKGALCQCREIDGSLAILLLDLDYFKKVNDLYGHSEGDKVLIKFSKLMKSQLRETDTFTRWGGEEFVILISNIDKENAIFIAEKLRKATEEFDFSREYNVTCSIGVAQFEKNDDIESLFNRVDNALYEAKENGRNLVKAH